MTLSFEKIFPTEEERYEKYIWLIKLTIIANICAYIAIILADADAIRDEVSTDTDYEYHQNK